MVTPFNAVDRRGADTIVGASTATASPPPGPPGWFRGQEGTPGGQARPLSFLRARCALLLSLLSCRLGAGQPRGGGQGPGPRHRWRMPTSTRSEPHSGHRAVSISLLILDFSRKIECALSIEPEKQPHTSVATNERRCWQQYKHGDYGLDLTHTECPPLGMIAPWGARAGASVDWSPPSILLRSATRWSGMGCDGS